MEVSRPRDETHLVLIRTDKKGKREMVTIPSPYTGLTLRLGAQEVNVHSVSDGVVYYGKYEDGEELPVAMYRMREEDFINSAGRSILDGALVYSRIQ